MTSSLSSSSCSVSSLSCGGGLRDLAPDDMPFVTLCTPTFNRRPFIAATMDCVLAQTYPHHRMEWLVVDDGTDPVGDLFPSNDDDKDATTTTNDLPAVRYVYTGPDKMPLGAKRNHMNSIARGEILVYWDDDDYYPPTRVAHAVDMLLRHPEYRIAGTKSIHVHYAESGAICQYGPYASSPELASAATFAFRRTYDGRYETGAALAEESSFTRGFTEPMLALDPRQTILVFAHDQNSYDKRWALRAQTHNGVFGATELTVDDFVRAADDADWALVASSGASSSGALSSSSSRKQHQEQLRAQLRSFYLEEMPLLLANYAQGTVTNKPDVMDTLRLLGQLPPEATTTVAPTGETEAPKEEEAPKVEEAVPVVPVVPGTNVYEVAADGTLGRMLTAHEVVARIQQAENKVKFAENERLAVARERDALGAQAEHWKQECAKLRGARRSGDDDDGAGGDTKEQNKKKKRKFGLEDYERCIAELVCERLISVPS